MYIYIYIYIYILFLSRPKRRNPGCSQANESHIYIYMCVERVREQAFDIEMVMYVDCQKLYLKYHCFRF